MLPLIKVEKTTVAVHEKSKRPPVTLVCHKIVFALPIVLVLVYGGLSGVKPLDLPANTTVSNLPPIISAIQVSSMVVDPLTTFTVAVTAEDKNTLWDVSRVDVVLKDPNGYVVSTFRWTQAGFDAPGGKTHLLLADKCIEPLQKAVANGTWFFCLRAPTNQPCGSMLVEARVWDEAGHSNESVRVNISKFASASVHPERFDDLIHPGISPEGIIVLDYTANTQIDVLAKSTPIQISGYRPTFPPEFLTLELSNSEPATLHQDMERALFSALPGKNELIELTLRVRGGLPWKPIRSGILTIAIRESPS